MEARRVLIDTTLFIEHFRARDKSATTLVRIHEQRHVLFTSTIVVAELCYGARNATQRADVIKVLARMRILPFTARMALRVSIEVEKLRRSNQITGMRDLAIACAALEAGLPVATKNQREFARVSGVRVFDLATD